MKSDKEKQFEELVKQYKQTIYSVCYMFSRDKEEINDLFQEILVRLWLASGTNCPGGATSYSDCQNRRTVPCRQCRIQNVSLALRRSIRTHQFIAPHHRRPCVLAATAEKRNSYFPVVKLISVFLPPVWPSWVMKREPITAKPYWWDGSKRKTTSKVLSSRQA